MRVPRPAGSMDPATEEQRAREGETAEGGRRKERTRRRNRGERKREKRERERNTERPIERPKNGSRSVVAIESWSAAAATTGCPGTREK